MSPLAEVSEAADPLIDRFIDALWLEDGLSRNTLAAYRRDLALYGDWLRGRSGTLAGSSLHDIQAWFAAIHQQSVAGPRRKAPATASVNRRIAVLRRFFRWAQREGVVPADPTLQLENAKRTARNIRTLGQSDVERLLSAPDVDTALGLRDRAMLELMYASGLRVSELVTLKALDVSLGEHVVRVVGKGSKTRLVPFGEEARRWLERYLAEARNAILDGKTSDALFVTALGGALLRLQRQHQPEQRRGDDQRQAGDGPVREAFHQHDEFERRLAGEHEVERAVLVVGLKQPVQSQKRREQGGDPQDRGADARQKVQVRPDGEGRDGDENEKEDHAHHAAAADAARRADLAQEQRGERGCARARAAGCAHGPSSPPAAPSSRRSASTPSGAWVAAITMPPCARCSPISALSRPWPALSSAVSGSSRIQIGRGASSSRARPTRRRCPAER